jgi:hypothetical protein
MTLTYDVVSERGKLAASNLQNVIINRHSGLLSPQAIFGVSFSGDAVAA